MAYGVTSTGFKAKRYEDIYNDVKARFVTDLGIDIDRFPDTVEKLITNIITLPLAQSWGNTQTLQSMFDLDKAEGVWLENLASFFGITRSTGSYSRGFEHITVSSPLSVMADEVFKNAAGDEFTNDNIITINQDNLTKIKLNTPSDNPTLLAPVVIIDGVVFSGVATNPAITGVQELVEAVNQSSQITVLAEAVIVGDNVVVEVASTDKLQNYKYEVSPTVFSVEEMTSFGEIRYTELGVNTFIENTITVAPNYTAILSVTNEEPITGGSGVETDAELRVRVKLSRRTGKATIEAIKTAILNVTGVTTAIVLENDTLVYDNVNAIDEKSFKCIVKGGDSTTIAKAIWDSKGAGISTSGDDIYIIKDSQNEDQAVKFSRVDNVYVHVEVTYSLYSEEVPPSDIEDSIREQVLAYGESLGVGVDVIQGRIESSIYQNVGGLEEVVVKIGVTVAPNDPTPTLQTSPPVRVSGLQEANFSLDRITASPL